jgi:hypothetical protein
MGKMKLGEAENGHELELKTITEKSTKNTSNEFYDLCSVNKTYQY